MISLVEPPQRARRPATERDGKVTSEFLIGETDDFEDNSKIVVAVGKKEVGVFRKGDEFFAYENLCPHRRGPVCQGGLFQHVIEPIAEDGSVRTLDYRPGQTNIVCPWHGYEYDVSTGENVGNPALRLRKIELRIADGRVYVRV
ncbi:Rieske (2Fe-2S) protein [Pseudorhodoplanes sp.]|uniref:Rieske (2Fe-2S) protein n=1 Tax=Pseudorhodoplanes sp. TaxID=1934341 RepID=UPI003D11E8EC